MRRASTTLAAALVLGSAAVAQARTPEMAARAHVRSPGVGEALDLILPIMAEEMSASGDELRAMMVISVAENFTAPEVEALTASCGHVRRAAAMAKMQPMMTSFMTRALPPAAGGDPPAAQRVQTEMQQ